MIAMSSKGKGIHGLQTKRQGLELKLDFKSRDDKFPGT